MAYSALETMRQCNRSIYGEDTGPLQPSLYQSGKGYDLKSAALRFLHERCEGLRFDEKIDQNEQNTGIWEGTGLKKGRSLMLCRWT